MKNTTVNPKERNCGIDLLKITAMFFIVCWHLIVHCGAFADTKSWICILNKSIFVCGVNCFALASGYILSNIKYKPHRIIVYWLQVAFYSVSITLLFMFFSPYTIPRQEIWHSFLPFRYDCYWYFSAYLILYLFVPFYNAVLDSLSKRKTYLFVSMLILVFSMLNFGRVQEHFYLSGGYSFYWLSILYIIGAVIRKYIDVKKYKPKFLLMGLVLCVFLTFLFTFHEAEYFISFLLNVDNFSYNNIIILFYSLFMMILFIKIQIKNHILIKIISKISGLTFGVYLIHDNEYIRKHIISNLFGWLSELNPILNTLEILGSALVIFVVCLIIDYIRAFLFNIFKVNVWCEKICGFFIKKMNLLFKES